MFPDLVRLDPVETSIAPEYPAEESPVRSPIPPEFPLKLVLVIPWISPLEPDWLLPERKRMDPPVLVLEPAVIEISPPLVIDFPTATRILPDESVPSPVCIVIGPAFSAAPVTIRVEPLLLRAAADSKLIAPEAPPLLAPDLSVIEPPWSVLLFPALIDTEPPRPAADSPT
jgi:hypothetical protein